MQVALVGTTKARVGQQRPLAAVLVVATFVLAEAFSVAGIVCQLHLFDESTCDDGEEK